MGTRSLTKVMDDGKVLLCIYRRRIFYDGDPAGFSGKDIEQMDEE
jgi:hypothetical protein